MSTPLPSALYCMTTEEVRASSARQVARVCENPRPRPASTGGSRQLDLQKDEGCATDRVVRVAPQRVAWPADPPVAVDRASRADPIGRRTSTTRGAGTNSRNAYRCGRPSGRYLRPVLRRATNPGATATNIAPHGERLLSGPTEHASCPISPCAPGSARAAMTLIYARQESAKALHSFASSSRVRSPIRQQQARRAYPADPPEKLRRSQGLQPAAALSDFLDPACFAAPLLSKDEVGVKRGETAVEPCRECCACPVHGHHGSHPRNPPAVLQRPIARSIASVGRDLAKLPHPAPPLEPVLGLHVHSPINDAKVVS